MTKNVQGEFSRFSFDIYKLLERAKSIVPSIHQYDVSVWIIKRATLAFINLSGDQPKIVLHPLLNHPDTPLEVVRFILVHELIHIIVPSIKIDGKLIIHSEDFWSMEKALVPERTLYWSWMYFHFYDLFKKENEAIRVMKKWEKAMHGARMSLKEYREKMTFPYNEILNTLSTFL